MSAEPLKELNLHPSEKFDPATIEQLKTQGWTEQSDLTSDQLSDLLINNADKPTREFFNSETNRYTLMIGPEVIKVSQEINDIRSETSTKASEIKAA